MSEKDAPAGSSEPTEGGGGQVGEGGVQHRRRVVGRRRPVSLRPNRSSQSRLEPENP